MVKHGPVGLRKLARRFVASRVMACLSVLCLAPLGVKASELSPTTVSGDLSDIRSTLELELRSSGLASPAPNTEGIQKVVGAGLPTAAPVPGPSNISTAMRNEIQFYKLLLEAEITGNFNPRIEAVRSGVFRPKAVGLSLNAGIRKDVDGYKQRLALESVPAAEPAEAVDAGRGTETVSPPIGQP